jgi:hypothetical protein
VDPDRIDELAMELAFRISRARESLAAEMLTLGLTSDDGWRIVEEIRSSISGTLLVLKPLHLRLPTPNIEKAVQIGPDGHSPPAA